MIGCEVLFILYNDQFIWNLFFVISIIEKGVLLLIKECQPAKLKDLSGSCQLTYVSRSGLQYQKEP